jgi:antitoxin ParD1/3/4
MNSMNISLPMPLKEFVETQVQAGGYSSASEYVRELIRRAQKEHSEEELERLLLEGLKSGEPIAVTPEYWQKKRAKLASRAKSRKKSE